MRILFVDDEPTIRSAIEWYFSSRDYVLSIAEDLATALSFLRDHTYDIVISDLRLSGTDNIEGLEILKFARERFPEGRTVLLTGYGSPAVQAQARELGVTLVLQKPIGLNELEQLITDLTPSPSRPD